jgi:HEAT repeat protein
VKQSWTASIRDIFYARAWVRSCVQAVLFAVVALVYSSALILAKEIPVIDHIQKLQELAEQNSPGAEVKLIETLQTDPDSAIRYSVAKLLGKRTQNPDIVKVLANVLQNDSDKGVRYACALSLGLSPTFKAITALERASDDPDPVLRQQVAISLRRHRKGQNKRKADDILKKLKRDSDPSVRALATEAAR